MLGLSPSMVAHPRRAGLDRDSSNATGHLNGKAASLRYGVIMRPMYPRRCKYPRRRLRGLAPAIALLIIGSVYAWGNRSQLAAAISPSCTIKGNVSMTSGQRIYHSPGQLDYDATIIRSRNGERWFCSPEEAERAGWRRASR